jgi:hypothetical protein
LSDALPGKIAEHMEFCWAHADVVLQRRESDGGDYRRLVCHAAYVREGRRDVHEAIVQLLAQVREARARVTDAAGAAV